MKEHSVVASPPDTDLPDKLHGIEKTYNFSCGFFILPVIVILSILFLVIILSSEPLRTLFFFFIGPVRNPYNFGNMLNASIPLIIGALGVTVSMKAGSLNLGGEGQIYAGAFSATVTALALGRLGALGAIIAFLAAFLTGGILCGLCGYCKAKWNISEIITTFLLSNAVIPIINFLVTGPFLDPNTSLQSTRKIPSDMLLPRILGQSNLSCAFLIALVLAVFIHIFLNNTTKGYEIRMGGMNEIFARYGGINTKNNMILAMFISGGLYGLAGAIAVFGIYNAAIIGFSSGLGWNGLAAALIARFFPPAVIPAAVFLAWVTTGARIAMQNTGISRETASIVQAVIFFFSTSLVIRNIFKKNRKIKTKEGEIE
jgi:simple sugar transport system permease protein